MSMTLKENQTRQSDSSLSTPAPSHHAQTLGCLVIFACLTIVWLLCFGHIDCRVGFYLDDWATFSPMHFVEKTWWSLFQSCLADDRLVIRPLECGLFALTWLAFGDHPLGHHLINGAFEILGAFLAHLALSRLTANRALSLVAALLVLIYPTHDATHYWVIASAISGALTLYLLSLYL